GCRRGRSCSSGSPRREGRRASPARRLDARGCTPRSCPGGREGRMRFARSQLLVRAFDGGGAALACEIGAVASSSERRDGILGNAEPGPKPCEQWAHIRLERLEQDPVAAEDVSCELRFG